MELLLFSSVLIGLTVFAVNGAMRVVFDSSLFASYRETLATLKASREASGGLETPQEIAEAGVIVVPPQGWSRVLGRLPTIVLKLLSCEYCLSHWVTFVFYGLFVGPGVFCFVNNQIGVAYALAAVPAVFGTIELRRLLTTHFDVARKLH